MQSNHNTYPIVDSLGRRKITTKFQKCNQIGKITTAAPIMPKANAFEETDVTNFTINAGGWRCRHRLLPAPDSAVPEDVRKKLEEKTNFAAKSENKNDLTDKEKNIEKSKSKFNSYDDKDWIIEYFDEQSGGYIAYHRNNTTYS